MTEIEKMFENAGIKGEWRDYRTKNGKIYEGKNPKNRNIRLCKPRFTAEKQLELIKWLFKISDIENINIECEDKFCIHNVLGQSDDCDTLEDALASYINDIWQDLTDQEKEEIRRILNE